MGEKNNGKCRIFEFSLGSFFCSCSLTGVTNLSYRRKYKVGPNAHWTITSNMEEVAAE